MKKLGKVLKTAEVSGENKSCALKTFLRAYRETPHPSTGVAPAILLMGFSRTSGIPQIEISPTEPSFLVNLHLQAQSNDHKAKERMKIEYDRRMRVVERNIGVGSRVLLKRQTTSKREAPWDPDPFRVTHMNGSLITAKLSHPKNQTVVSNSSFFKVYRADDTDMEDDLIEESPREHTKQKTQEARMDEDIEAVEGGHRAASGNPEETDGQQPTNVGESAVKPKRGRPTKAENT